MTTEEKQLLLKDLCGRLPYGVKVGFKDSVLILKPRQYDISTGQLFAHQIYPESSLSTTYGYSIHNYRPYLRPMSSMTEEEFKEYEKENDIDTADSSETLRENLKAKAKVRVSKWYHGSDWLDAHHFDYRGLIPMGLALEAKEGMYE